MSDWLFGWLQSDFLMGLAIGAGLVLLYILMWWLLWMYELWKRW